MSDIPLSLYVHFPWCVRKCPYCDFNSHVHEGDFPEEAYVEALIQDLSAEASMESRTTLTSIFLGGGTPSLFSADAINHLLEEVSIRFDIKQAEITIEANPGTFDQSHFDGYRTAGVNRISLGAQSFSNDSLKSLGRIHEASEIEIAYQGARTAGFERINIDLMNALPGQTESMALKDLNAALALSPEHISWYQLTIEPNTAFFSEPPDLPDDDLVMTIYESGAHRLNEFGFKNYETSAWCKPGEESQHNLNYWQFGDYLGIGAGAHGKLSRGGKVQRTRKTRLPRDYLTFPKRLVDEVQSDELVTEFLMNALRLTHGFDYKSFESRTFADRLVLAEFTDRALQKGLIETNTEVGIQPSEFGRRMLNDLLLLI